MTTTGISERQMGGRSDQTSSPLFASSYVRREPVIGSVGVAKARRNAQPGAIEPIDSASQFIN